MSEKPQTARGDEDLLEQIITQGLEKISASAQTAAAEKTPPEAASSPSDQKAEPGDTPPANRKARQSAVYLYLLVLFGAAFLMLLLAYFVQQRSSEDAMSVLRDSMNLSRQELLDEIRDLKEENEALNEKIGLLNDDISQWQERYEEKEQQAADLLEQNIAAQDELSAWTSFWKLEKYYQAEDYESCAALFLLQLQNQYDHTAPWGTGARQLEILEAVIDAGILDVDYASHASDYNDLLQAYLDQPALYGAGES